MWRSKHFNCATHCLKNDCLSIFEEKSIFRTLINFLVLRWVRLAAWHENQTLLWLGSFSRPIPHSCFNHGFLLLENFTKSKSFIHILNVSLGQTRLDSRHRVFANGSTTSTSEPFLFFTIYPQTLIRKRRVYWLLILMVAVFMGSWMPLSVVNILRDMGVGFLDVQMYFKLLNVHALAMTTLLGMQKF